MDSPWSMSRDYVSANNIASVCLPHKSQIVPVFHARWGFSAGCHSLTSLFLFIMNMIKVFLLNTNCVPIPCVILYGSSASNPIIVYLLQSWISPHSRAVEACYFNFETEINKLSYCNENSFKICRIKELDNTLQELRAQVQYGWRIFCFLGQILFGITFPASGLSSAIPLSLGKDSWRIISWDQSLIMAVSHKWNKRGLFKEF